MSMLMFFRAVTLVGEQERQMFAKIAKRAAENSIKVRLVSKG